MSVSDGSSIRHVGLNPACRSQSGMLVSILHASLQLVSNGSPMSFRWASTLRWVTDCNHIFVTFNNNYKNNNDNINNNNQKNNGYCNNVNFHCQFTWFLLHILFQLNSHGTWKIQLKWRRLKKKTKMQIILSLFLPLLRVKFSFPELW